MPRTESGLLIALALLSGCGSSPSGNTSITSTTASVGSSGGPASSTLSTSSATGGSGSTSTSSSSGALTSSTSSSGSSAGASSSSSGTPLPDAGAGADAGLWPQLVNLGAAPLSALHLVVITAPGDPLESSLTGFAQDLVQGEWLATVGSEFGVAAAPPAQALVGATLDAGTILDDGQLRLYVAAAIQGQANAAPTSQTVYLLYLPEGVAYTGNAACTLASGYHIPYDSSGASLALIQRCQSTFDSPIEQLTIVGSHEVIESATDPNDSTGWGLYPGTPAWSLSPWSELDDGYPEEVGDLCIGTRTYEAGYAYQRSYSNLAASAGGDPCVPPLPIPYYNVLSATGWTAGTAGATTSIPLTGWATSPTSSWIISNYVAAQSDSSLSFTSALAAPTETIGSLTFNTLAAGDTYPLQVTIPANAVSGDWAVVKLYSFRLDSNGYPPAGEDYAHGWAVGVYLP